MAKRLMSVLIILLVLGIGLLALAWYDGGREEQRLVEQPVSIPAANMTENAE